MAPRGQTEAQSEAQSEAQAASEPGPQPAATPDIVALVAGQPITAAELIATWMHREAPAVRAMMEHLIFGRLGVAEGARLEIQLDPAMLEGRYQEGIERLESEIARTEGSPEEGGPTLERFIRVFLGLDPDLYRQELRRGLEIDLLVERCVRAWLLSAERAEVRMIVVDSRETLDDIRTALDAGGDFGDLAKTYSQHASSESGGRMTPVVRSDAGISRLAFATRIGEVGGPIFEQGTYLLIQVLERPEPLEGKWSLIGEAVEASLAERPIEDLEYMQWKAAMQEIYEVDLSPLLELVGEVPVPNPDPDPEREKP